MAPVDYYSAQKAAIRRALRGSEVLIACVADDEDTIVGWACVSGTTLHYVDVAREFRGQGIARALLRGRTIRHYTHKSTGLTKAPPRGWAYHPFLFWSPPAAKAEEEAA